MTFGYSLYAERILKNTLGGIRVVRTSAKNLHTTG
jgi:hypothetical protein